MSLLTSTKSVTRCFANKDLFCTVVLRENILLSPTCRLRAASTIPFDTIQKQLSRRKISTMSKMVLFGGGGMFLVANIGFVASAVPAVLGLGAPYLGTSQESLDIIFTDVLPSLLKAEQKDDHQEGEKDEAKAPLIVDLGSGDGRVCLQAARNGYRAIGYEFNPILVTLSRIWALQDSLKNGYSHSPKFYTKDLWKVNLSCQKIDVIFVYGLNPIMEKLSAKVLLESPNAIVISNVFEMDQQKWLKVYEKGQVLAYRSKKSRN